MGDTREIRLCHLIRWPDFNGYGFNLHAEKGKAGQYIGKVDENSPAELAKLQPGDRIVEVNGVNIGNENHQQVVSRIKAGGNETRMLVLSDEEEAYFKEKKIVVTGDLPSVKCYSTPVPRPAPGTEGASGVVEEEKLPVNGEVQKSSEPEVDESAAAVAVVTVTEVASEQLPETPSEPDETPVNEDDTPASTEAPPSEPPQDEVIVATEETAHEDEDDEPVYEQPDAPVPEPEPTVVVVPPPEFEPIVASEPPPPEPEPPKEPEPEPPKEPEPEPPKEPEPEPPKEPEPVPVPEPAKEPEPTPPPAEPVSQPPAQPTNGVDGGLNLNISAKEMRERLNSKKKADPRLKGGSFQHKYDVFQRM